MVVQTDEFGDKVPSNPFKVIRMSDVMAMEPQEWALDSFIYDDSIVVVFGPSGDGKSFLTFNWFAHFAACRDWLGYHVRNCGLMIYTAAEGVRGYQRRARALEKERGISIESLEENLMWITTAVQLDNRPSIEAYIAAINEAKGERPLLGLCIDTLFQCAGGVDINKPGDASKMMNAIKYIKDETKASFVIVVHHTGKDEARGATGSQVIKNNCDLMYEVKRDELTNVMTVKSHKVKDDEAIEKVFVLKRIVYGDGPRDHSMVVVSTESQVDETIKSFNSLPFIQQKVLDALGDKQLKNGQWKQLCSLQGIKANTFDTSLRALIEKNLVHKVEPDKNSSAYIKGPAPEREQATQPPIQEVPPVYEEVLTPDNIAALDPKNMRSRRLA